MDEILKHVLFNQNFIKLSSNDPNLSVTKENIERLLSQAITYKAQKCYNVLLKYQPNSKSNLTLQFPKKTA